MTSRRLQAQGPSTRYLENVATRLSELLITRQRCDYELGRVLDEVMTGEYWCREDWPGAPAGGYPKSQKGLTAWCIDVLGFKLRKAYYFRSIFLNLSALRLPENGDTFSRALRLGWTKLAEVLKVAKTGEALVEWLNRVDGMTFDAVRAEVRIAISGTVGGGQEPSGPTPAAGDLQPGDGEEEADDNPGGHPTGYYEDPETGEPLPARAKPKAARVEWPLSFEKAEDVRAYTKVLNRAKLAMGTDSDGEAALRMALYYQSNSPELHEGGQMAEAKEMVLAMLAHSGDRAADVEGILQAVEQVTGKRVRIDDPSAPARRDAALEGFGV